jgi:hypothetical protein
MNNPEIQATVDIRRRTRTNTTQKNKKMRNTESTKQKSDKPRYEE